MVSEILLVLIIVLVVLPFIVIIMSPFMLLSIFIVKWLYWIARAKIE